MGPRFRKRGNCCRTRGFGQRPMLQWGRAFARARKRGGAFQGDQARREAARFNGAALSGERGNHAPPARAALAEQSAASMGPRSGSAGRGPPRAVLFAGPTFQWGRAFVRARKSSIRRGLPGLSRIGFNGAALSEERGNCPSISDAEAESPASMGPRFGSAETRAPQSTMTTLHLLQWGRAFGSAETATRRRRDARIYRASMGPRFRKRGNMERRLEEGAGGGFASMGPRFRKRGNTFPAPRRIARVLVLRWGRAFGSAKLMASDFASYTCHRASMGPRFRKRGNSSAVTCTVPAAALQWGRAFGSAETSEHFTRPLIHPELLQWGRAFGSAETGLRGTAHGSDRQSFRWGRAFGSAETAQGRMSGPTRRLSFNGAALSEARKLAWAKQVFSKTRSASMGPRFRKRGELEEAMEVSSAAIALQWGRAFGSAETCVLKKQGCNIVHPASMGPRFRKRGNVEGEGDDVVGGGDVAFNGAALSEARKRGVLQ